MICDGCYREIPSRSRFCPRCGVRQGAFPGGPVPETRTARLLTNPWEVPSGRGSFAAFGETLQEAIFRPAAFFRGTGTETGVGRALLYAACAGTLSFLGALLWQRVLGDVPGWRWRQEVVPHGVSLLVLAPLVLPAVVALTCVVWAGALHVSLKLLGGASRGYRATLKGVCYATSASVFTVFPILGAPVAGVWQVVLQVIGLRELHRTTTARAFGAWVLPVLVIAVMAVLAVAALVAGLAHLWQELGMRLEA